ncbi:inositol monophosphatase family protein [Staphylococcus lutrae]|uniref:inositol-phosphate phosphatase n=1 Tax=Staphylococcus lutrae TaxID=155085 RepID=A0AAC9RV02_9STAP|nr:inositol monophosphatase family protein [Staphylococcus lutrae]ARJ51545.1 inositol monophosphatase [Staphylococcus lutrae]PNZ39217.1 inositol monophosphatase family protein [Staphylococcus lutrae]
MHLYDFAKSLVLEAGNNIRKWMVDELAIEVKSNPNDLVTNVDKAVEAFIVQKIQERYPHHRIIGEEGHGHDIHTTEGVVWVIDPIDGTLNFIHQGENFAISIGVFKEGQAYAGFVYDVMNDILYHAKVGQGAYQNQDPIPQLSGTKVKESIIGMNPNWLTKPFLSTILQPVIADSRSARAYGSAALEIVYVATGHLAAYLTPRLQPWDYAGGMIILEEVGGIATNFLGEPLSITRPNSILVGNREVHEEIRQSYLQNYDFVLQALQQKFQKKK